LRLDVNPVVRSRADWRRSRSGFLGDVRNTPLVPIPLERDRKALCTTRRSSKARNGRGPRVPSGHSRHSTAPRPRRRMRPAPDSGPALRRQWRSDAGSGSDQTRDDTSKAASAPSSRWASRSSAGVRATTAPASKCSRTSLSTVASLGCWLASICTSLVTHPLLRPDRRYRAAAKAQRHSPCRNSSSDASVDPVEVFVRAPAKTMELKYYRKRPDTPPFDTGWCPRNRSTFP